MDSNFDIDIQKKRDEIRDKLFPNIEKDPGENFCSLEVKNPCLKQSIVQNEPDYIQFPELVLLNESSDYNPVFWIHSVGGVQPYFMIAKNSLRPFYGIEARGWRTNRFPLRGIQAVAAYYIHIIKSIQPKGPYDLGGYSLGGLISYEVARQLQEFGDTVDSIVMLDTLDPSVLTNIRGISYKSRLLQGVNFLLATKVLKNAEELQKILIDRSEIDWSLDENSIVCCLSKLAKEKGLFQSENQIQIIIQKMAKVQEAYEYDRYTVPPLERPEEIKCYYFKNKSGVFFGEFSPYYWIPDDEVDVNYLNYWSLWEENLPNINIIDVDSSNHMVILHEEKAYNSVLKFCKQLYSQEGISEEFLSAFK